MKYLPFELRTPDHQYRDLLNRIYSQGEIVDSRQGVPARTVMQATMHYDLRNGFPVIPDRDVSSFWSKGIGELCAFINGATTLSEFRDFGVDWWGPWATHEKTSSRNLPSEDIGSASYGGAFHDFPTHDGSHFNQFKHLVEQIRDEPEVRTHFITPWIPDGNVRGSGKVSRNTISPCHGWVHVRVLNGRLHLHMYQRSADAPVGLPSNMIQYASLLLMLEQLTGYSAATYYHTISDAHIYSNQVAEVEAMLGRTALALPTVELTAVGQQITDIHDFRAEHFALTDYHPHPSLRIPVLP